jgi:hypothetical protein
MKYKITEEFNKRFIIDFGLRPGYQEGIKPFSVFDVKEWYAQWQTDRASQGESFFAGMVTESNFVYAYKKDGKVKAEHEPAARIEGEITKANHEDIYENEEKILEIIFDLANFIGMKAQQHRVHILYNGRFFVLEIEQE